MPTPNKPNRQTRQVKPQADDKSKDYMAKEPGTYKNAPEMVPINDSRYLSKDKVGKRKSVRAPGAAVVRVGLGNLKVIHQNPIDYHGNIDLRSDSGGST